MGAKPSTSGIEDTAGKKTMRAVVFSKYGGPEVASIATVAKPEPKEGQVLIAVKAASLNPIDYKARSGALKAIAPARFPYVPCYDVSGVVAKTGEGVTKVKEGDEVFARIGGDRAPYGTLAEFTVVADAHVAKKPAKLSHAEAAAVPLALLTAVQSMERGRVVQDKRQKVFIPAGAGGVGSFALQVAKHVYKCEEVATTVSAAKMDIAKKLGADTVIDYKTTDYEKELKDFDFVFDTSGDVMKELTILRSGGTLVSIATMPDRAEAEKAVGKLSTVVGLMLDAMTRKYRVAAAKAGVEYSYVFMHPTGEMLESFAPHFESGAVAPLMDSTFTFEAFAEAFAKLESGHATGKIVITIP